MTKILKITQLTIFFLFLIYGISCDSNERDSYLDAFKVSHGLNPHLVQKSDRAAKDGYPYPAPQPVYGNPAPAYGVPSAPPAPIYGEPAPVYGPVIRPVYQYGPPEPSYGMPHGMLGLLDKLKFKIDLFTLGKIILKLVIFKKIVSLIAVLCLLLFIPSLKHKKETSTEEDEEDESRKFNQLRTGERTIKSMTQFVEEAIADFSAKEERPLQCDSIYCQAQTMIKRINKKMSYKKLAKLYEKEQRY